MIDFQILKKAGLSFNNQVFCFKSPETRVYKIEKNAVFTFERNFCR